MPSRSIAAASTLLTAAFLLAYLPDVGHGFVKDDFAWIAHARLEGPGSFERVVFRALSFYRPVVSLTFSVNDLVFGFAPLGYGLTNLALALACAVAVAWLARALGMAAGAAVMAAALWAFNFHGINMAVLWISGRTALCLTLFAVLAARAAVNGQRGLVLAWSLLAALSKEEAVLLPLVCGVLAIRVEDTASPRAMLKRAWPMLWPSLAAVAAYLALRAQSGAMTPANAPGYYQFTPRQVIENVLQYLDRSATFPVLVLLAALMLIRAWPPIDRRTGWRLAQGGLWVVLAFGVTVWLPVRSSLYAVWPSVGAALAVASLVEASWPRANHRQMRIMTTAGLLLPFLFWPVYHSRNVRWVELADLTRDALAAVAADRDRLPPGSLVVLQDDRSTRANFNNAFGTLFPDAATLALGSQVELWIDPPPDELQAAGVARPDRPLAATYALTNGRVIKRP